MYESKILARLIKEDIININSLLIKHHKKLDITPNDIVVLSALTRQEIKRDVHFSIEKIKEKVGLSNEVFFESIQRLEDKGYVNFDSMQNVKSGKGTMIFILDGLYDEIVKIYQDAIRAENEEKNESFELEISNLFERTFQRPMTPSDAEVLRKWVQESLYPLDQIKSEILDAAKLGKFSLKYVDSRLVKKSIQMSNNPEYQKTSQVIQELSEKWKK